MITIKKLLSLNEDTKLRKTLRLLEEFSRNRNLDPLYLISLVEIIISSEDSVIHKETKDKAVLFLSSITKESDCDVWILQDFIFLLKNDLNISLGDWDFVDNENQLDVSKRSIFPISVVLDRIRSPFNVGSMFRTSDSFGVEKILLTTPCADVEHPRTLRSAAGCTKSVPYTTGSPVTILKEIRDKPVFALELGGDDISSFSFPRHGVMVVGSEELGVSGDLLSLAKSSLGVVSIPLFGTKGSLNVSTAFAIAMYNWVMAIKKNF